LILGLFVFWKLRTADPRWTWCGQPRWSSDLGV